RVRVAAPAATRTRSGASWPRSLRDDLGTKSAQTRITPPATVHIPAGGWGLGMGPTPGAGERGARVLVTRPREQAEPLAAELRRLGVEVEVCPLIEIEPIDDGP